MRKPKFNEIFVMLFSLYVWFTLTIAPELFIATNGKSGDIYATYIGIVGNQKNLSFISAVISFMYFTGLFTKNYNVIIWIHIFGLIYFLFIGASFLINYPNIAFGIMSMASVWLFIDLTRLIDKAEEVKKNKILKKNGIKQ